MKMCAPCQTEWAGHLAIITTTRSQAQPVVFLQGDDLPSSCPSSFRPDDGRQPQLRIVFYTEPNMV